MCYNSSQLANKLFKDAKRQGASEEVLAELWEKVQEAQRLEAHLKAGFDHPILHVLELENDQIDIKFHYWGLIPKWIKSEQEAKEIQHRTLNARGETMFEKPAFTESALTRRCLIPMDGYFEHHHKNKQTFPYYIYPAGEDRLLIGGIVSEWTNPLTGEIKSTVAAVTSKANPMLAEIHNNPKMGEPRMLLILNDADTSTWLKGSEEEVKALIKPNTDIKLESYTVGRLTGKEAVSGEKVLEPKYYQELDEQGSLF